MNIDLSGKTALVCGSTQGIGKASAMELATLGARVVLVARNEQSLQATIAELGVTRQQKHGYIVADFQNASELKERVTSYLLTHPVHVLVNNTGGPPAGLIMNAKPEEFMSAFNNHLLCNHLLAQLVAEVMKKEGYGRIINIVSTSVRIPIANLGVSNTIRAAVAGWSKTLSNELAPFGITVNNVLPGLTLTGRLQSLIENTAKNTGLTTEQVATNMKNEIPFKRFAHAAEVANAVAFLASPAASYITGVSLAVDGGKISSI